MKGTKKFLVAFPALALLLSGCSFKEFKHSVGESWVGQHILHPVYDPIRDLVNGGDKKDDKKEEEKKEECKHQDANHDGVCDLCGVSGLPVEHSDANHDHLCDVCGSVVSEHKDENGDFICDICEAALDIVDVKLDTTNALLVFSLGEDFTSDGVKVVATSSVGSKKELEFSVSAPDMSTVGEKTVVVTYGSGENDKFEYTINVVYWSAEDLEVFEYASLTEYAPLPYVSGMHTVAEWEGEGDDKELVSWSIMLEDVSAEDYLSYYSKLKEYNHVVSVNNTDVTFALTEIAIEDADGYHDLTDVAVFALIPYYLDSEGYEERRWVYDEYLILGVNEVGSLVIESRLVNAMLDGYFFGNVIADGDRGFPAQYNEYIQYLPDQIYNYYSEYSYSRFVYPDFEGASFNFVPMSLFSLYPLDESLDEYDLAWEIELDYATADDLNGFYAKLEAYGYEATEHPATEDFPLAYVTYTLEDEFAGYMSYDVFYIEASGNYPSAILFDFYYNAPEQYTNHLSPVTKALCQILGAGEDLEIDDSLYEWFECSIGEFYGSLQGVESGEELIINYGRLLVELGFNVIEEIDYTEGDEKSSGYYGLTMGDEDYTFTIYVEDTANEDGAYLVEFDLYDQYLDASISKVETEGQSIHSNAFGFKGLRGVDYLVGSDEEGNEVVSAVVECGPAPEEGLDDTLEGVAYEVASGCLPESYIVASEELDSENSTFTLVCQDIERGFEVTFVSSVEEGELVVNISIVAKAFITPESVIVDFLTAHNGVAPTSDDYLVSDEDKSVLAELVIEDAEASAEGLETVALTLAAEFGESFVAGTPEPGEQENTVVLTLVNEVSGIDAQIVVGLGQESGYVANVYVEFHVEPVTGMSPLEAITEFVSYFSGQPDEVAEGVYGAYAAFPSATYSVDDMKDFVENLFVPVEFSLDSDWEESQGAEVCYYINAVGTVLEIYVYADVVYVDGDGNIVDEGTEGASPVDVTCLEVYSYTASN